MPEPFSTTLGICLIGYATVQACPRVSSAVSSESRAVRAAVTAVAERAEQSQALFGGKAAAISRLQTLANDCAAPNWDGEAACALNPMAVFLAESFVRVLPEGIPLPEFSAEPDGSVALDWIQSRNRLFSISVGSNNRLAYAWLDGADKGHAIARFDGDRVPQRILEGISAIMNHGNITLRAA